MSDIPNKKSIDTALVVQPVTEKSLSERKDMDQEMREACGLALAIDLSLTTPLKVNVPEIQAGHFFGKGTREKISASIEEYKPDIVIVNHTLSPVQQRNLEKQFNVKVIDRTGLILEIFGARAQTKEGKIQVELAQLEYQKSRLVKSWSHLERQRGGMGFMGGPGESQLEIDKRIIAERIANLKNDLIKVRKTRELGRQAREKVPFPIIALVGYTNAGKSTLFNKLTGSNVFVKDLLFATLDPTMRRIKLPSGKEAILSDTVGFISNLPTHLIEAFRATLEQTQYADIIVHVRDSTQKDYEAHKKDVISIMHDLGISYESDKRIMEVINKIDLCNPERLQSINRECSFNSNVLCLSAVTGEGLETLISALDIYLSKSDLVIDYKLSISDGKALAWLHQNGKVINTSSTDDNNLIQIKVQLTPVQKNKFERLFSYAPYQSLQSF